MTHGRRRHWSSSSLDTVPCAKTLLCRLLFLSLLDILAGRKNPRDVNGLVLVNGEKQPKNFKCIAGYVVQVRKTRYLSIPVRGC